MKTPLILTLNILIFIASVLGTKYFGSKSGFLHCLTYPSILVAGTYAASALFWLIFIAPIQIRLIAQLKKLPLEDLKKQVFRYDKKYFTAIDEKDLAVKRFMELISQEDIFLLIREWPYLEKRFVHLERLAGREGRPLIMDYYCWYELDLKELDRRMSYK